MKTALQSTADPSDATFVQEAMRVLRRLAEPGACLAVASDMEKGVVVRETEKGRTARIAVTGREIAEGMVQRDWITCSSKGRVSRYRINEMGQAALRRHLVAKDEVATNQFAEQHREWEARDHSYGTGAKRGRIRYNAAESPVQFLARRKTSDGDPFLSGELLAAAERLREDFELAQMGPSVTQNWDRFLTGGQKTNGSVASTQTDGSSEAAKRRVMDALEHLGPGLSDVVLRVCCFLEGLETAERRLGWSARSAKVVLRIALQRLHRYYSGQLLPGRIG